MENYWDSVNTGTTISSYQSLCTIWGPACLAGGRHWGIMTDVSLYTVSVDGCEYSWMQVVKCTIFKTNINSKIWM